MRPGKPRAKPRAGSFFFLEEDTLFFLIIRDDLIAVLEFALQHFHRHRALDVFLQRAVERTGAESRIESFLGELFAGGFRQGYGQSLLRESFLNLLHLQIDDFFHVREFERGEDDDLVDPVEKLRTEGALQRLLDLFIAFVLLAVFPLAEKTKRAGFGDKLRAEVAGQDQDRIAEIHRPPLAVGHPSIVEDLQ